MAEIREGAVALTGNLDAPMSDVFEALIQVTRQLMLVLEGYLPSGLGLSRFLGNLHCKGAGLVIIPSPETP